MANILADVIVARITDKESIDKLQKRVVDSDGEYRPDEKRLLAISFNLDAPDDVYYIAYLKDQDEQMITDYVIAERSIIIHALPMNVSVGLAFFAMEMVTSELNFIKKQCM